MTMSQPPEYSSQKDTERKDDQMSQCPLDKGGKIAFVHSPLIEYTSKG